ncbi:MAG TPA: DinB family protein [bacterium]
MFKENLIKDIQSAAEFFERSTSCLSEEDSNFKPRDEMYTVAHQVAHAAQTIDWSIDGMFNPKGFDTDFEKHIREAMACTSLKAAREWFKKATRNAVETIKGKSEDELRQLLPANTIMQGGRYTVISAITDHTAHHRGALTVYSRLLKKQPKMPYGDF